MGRGVLRDGRERLGAVGWPGATTGGGRPARAPVAVPIGEFREPVVEMTVPARRPRPRTVPGLPCPALLVVRGAASGAEASKARYLGR